MPTIREIAQDSSFSILEKQAHNLMQAFEFGRENGKNRVQTMLSPHLHETENNNIYEKTNNQKHGLHK